MQTLLSCTALILGTRSAIVLVAHSRLELMVSDVGFVGCMSAVGLEIE